MPSVSSRRDQIIITQHNHICHAELVSASIFAYSRAWILKQVQYDRFLYLLGYAISLLKCDWLNGGGNN